LAACLGLFVALLLTNKYCRWWGILYSSAWNRCLAFW